jgi:hypothetical protein
VEEARRHADDRAELPGQRREGRAKQGGQNDSGSRELSAAVSTGPPGERSARDIEERPIRFAALE